MAPGDGCETGRYLVPTVIVQIGHRGGERRWVFGGEAIPITIDGHDADVEPNSHVAEVDAGSIGGFGRLTLWVLGGGALATGLLSDRGLTRYAGRLYRLIQIKGARGRPYTGLPFGMLRRRLGGWRRESV